MSGVTLNRRLVLEDPGTAPDSAGGYRRTWTPLGQLWAAIRPGSGRIGRGEDAALSRLALRITVRGAPQGAVSRPRPGQRFREGDRLFAIEGVAESPDGTFLICNAIEELST